MSPSDDAGRSNAPAARGLYGQRPSRSHDAIRKKEFARIAAMTPHERMILALELGEAALELTGTPGETKPVHRRSS